MTKSQPTKIWIPANEVSAVSSVMPLELLGGDDGIVGNLQLAILDEPGHLGGPISRSHIIAKVRYYRLPGEIIGTYGSVNPGVLTDFPLGVIFTTLYGINARRNRNIESIEDEYHSGRIEVPTRDGGLDLDAFVLAAHKKYQLLGRGIVTGRDNYRHMLFYTREGLKQRAESPT